MKMKKIIIITLICICIVSPFLFGYIKDNFSFQEDFLSGKSTQIATWKDENFEKLIRIYIGKKDGDILLNELEGITELRIISKSSVETNLKKVEISETDQQNISLITSMADIDNFINLEKIEISSNHIQSIDTVNISPNITELNLTFNNLNNISGLEKYISLEKLSLDSNYIKDIKVLKDIKTLKELSLGYTGKKADNIFGCEPGKVDFSVIKELPLLEKLSIPFSIVENIDQLNGLSHLKILILSQCTLSMDELRKVKDIQYLEDIEIYNISIVGELYTNIDLSIFSDMKNLKKIVTNSDVYNVEILKNINLIIH